VLHELPQVELKVVSDRSVDRLAQARQRYPDIATAADLDEALGRDDIDAVVIATPASTHGLLVDGALRRGRHVLVEKPMALDAGECDALCRLASTSGCTLMVGYTFLYNAAIRKMKECMASEQFGQVYYLHATRTNLGPIRQDVNA